MTKDSNSKKMSKYDEAVLKKYKKFVGVRELKTLRNRFSSEKYVGTWKQVMASSSTRLVGGGLNYTSVKAVYKLRKDGLLSVKNVRYCTHAHLSTYPSVPFGFYFFFVFHY